MFLIFVLSAFTQLGKHWWPEWSLVNGIRVDYLSPTLFLSDLLFVAAFFTHCRCVIKQLWTRWRCILLFVCCELLVLAFTADRPILGIYWLLRYLQIPLTAWITCHYVKQRKKTRALLPIVLAAGSLCALVIGTLQVVLGKSTGLFWILGERTFSVITPGISTVAVFGQEVLRPYATFPHPNSLGGWLAVAALLLLYYSLRHKQKKPLRIASLLLGIGTLATASRLAISGLGIALGLLFLSPLVSNFTPTFITFPPSSLDERSALWSSAWNIFLAHPLFGVGPGNFIANLPGTLPPNLWLLQPVHNIPLLLLSEFGTIGAIGGIWAIWGIVRSIKLRKAPRLLLAALLVVLVTSMGDHYWVTAQQNRILLGILLGTIHSSSE